MLEELFNEVLDFFRTSKENADIPDSDLPEDCADDTDCDTIDVFADTGSAEASTGGGSTDDMLAHGISTDSVSDEELATLTGERKDTHHSGAVPFTGHTSGSCNLCSCSKFRPVVPGSKMCMCDHSDYQHVWS